MFLLVRRGDNEDDRKRIARKILPTMEDEELWAERGGYTILSYACKNGLPGVAKRILIRCCGLINRGNPHPLWIAANEGQVEVLKVLAAFKEIAHKEIVAPDGTTPLMMAIAKNNLQAFDVLKSFYPREKVLEDVITFGSTSLLLSIEYQAGQSHLSLAVQSGVPETVDMLLNDPRIVELLFKEQNDLPQSYSYEMLHILGKQQTSLTSQLTNMCRKFPLYNPAVEFDCRRDITTDSFLGGRKVDFINIDQVVLDRICSSNMDLNSTLRGSLPTTCEKSCKK